MGDHPLQLFAGQQIDRALGDADDRILWRESRSESVYAQIRQQVHRRHRGAGSDGHFFHHVEQSLLFQRLRAVVDQPAVETPRNHFAALRQLPAFRQAAHQHNADDHCRHGADQLPIQLQIHNDVSVTILDRNDHEQTRHRDQAEYREHHQKNQQQGASLGLTLLFKKIHFAIRWPGVRTKPLELPEWPRCRQTSAAMHRHRGRTAGRTRRRGNFA